MLVIRDAQMGAFYEAVVERYVQSRVAKIERDHAEKYAALGREGAEALVRDAVTRAKAYKIDDDDAVDRFLHLMLTLGSDFDAGTETSWTAKILGDHGIDERAKLDLIYASPRLPEAARRLVSSPS